MILTGKEIEKRLGKDIIIEPYNPSQLNPNSYNLRLDNKLLVYDEDILDMKKENKFKEIIIPEEGLVLEPGKLYLGKTVEYTETYNLVPLLEGRSSVGRLGLLVHLTAGFGDVSVALNWTLELACIQPIRIYPNIEICQIYYNEVKGEIIEYKGKYNNTRAILPSMMYKDFQK